MPNRSHRPDEKQARAFIKSLGLSCTVRAKARVNGVFQVFLNKAVEPVDYGFTKTEALQEAAIKLGWRPA